MVMYICNLRDVHFVLNVKLRIYAIFRQFLSFLTGQKHVNISEQARKNFAISADSFPYVSLIRLFLSTLPVLIVIFDANADVLIKFLCQPIVFVRVVSGKFHNVS